MIVPRRIVLEPRPAGLETSFEGYELNDILYVGFSGRVLGTLWGNEGESLQDGVSCGTLWVDSSVRLDGG